MSKKNLIFFLFFLFIRLSFAKCISNDFKLPLKRENCQCNDLARRPKGRTDFRIINGTTLDSRDLQYVASIYTPYYRKTKDGPKKVIESVCTGSIISPKFVLTAAHCNRWVNEFKVTYNYSSYVGAGSSRVIEDMHRSDDNHKKILKFIQHPQYIRYDDIEKQKESHDIGLVELESPFKLDLSLNIQPGCLYMDMLKAEDFEIKHNHQIIVAGYGWQVEADKNTASNRLKFARFEVIERHSNITITYIDKYTQPCIGDSGAPLLWKNIKDGKLYIIGIHLIGMERCSPGGRNTGKPIYGYLGWILKHVEGEVCGTVDKIDDWFDEEEKAQ